MPIWIVSGTHWGDEGKGKIVDYLTENADAVVRSQGGSNAGHTVVIQGEKFIFHLIPSGILHEETECFLGDGMVIDPGAFHEEIEMIRSRKKEKLLGNVFVSGRAHLVMPYHRLLDRLQEKLRGNSFLGTTGRGIGPAYEDKVARVGLRVVDLLDEAVFRKKLQRALDEKNRLLSWLYHHEPLSFDAVFRECWKFRETITPFVADVSRKIFDLVSQGKRVLIEGAQGTMLDLDHGTYPFVTSSYPVSSGSLLGAGVGPTDIREVIGICKAYTTRVGEGPFPTELNDPIGSSLRERGGEYGATTGRPRRCGWLDGVSLNYALRVNGLTTLALTKLDVLGGLSPIKMCTAYRMGNDRLDGPPLDWNQDLILQPEYEEFPGWDDDITSIRRFADLPSNARAYVESIEDYTGIPVGVVSVGPNRDATIIRREFSW